MQAFNAPWNKKPGELSSAGLLVVDYMSEISNLDLVRDIYKIIELLSDKIWQVGIIHDPF